MAMPSVSEIMPKKKGKGIMRKQMRLDGMFVLDNLFRVHFKKLCVEHGLVGDEGWANCMSKCSGANLDHIGAWHWFLRSFERDSFDGNEYIGSFLQTVRSSVGEWRKVSQSRRAAIMRAEAYAAIAPEETEQEDDFYRSQRWRRLRYDFLKTAKAVCNACGRSRADHGIVVHVDHIQPRSKHPLLALEITNLQVLCEDCNMGKGNRDDIDWRSTPQNDDVPQEDAA